MIGKTIYEDQLHRREQRIEAMIEYADNDDGCRVERMLRYFGEPDSRPCGGCDICRSASEAKRRQLSDAELYRLLLAYLTARPQGVRYEMIEYEFQSDKVRIVTLIRHLCHEGLLISDGPLILLPK